VSAVDETHARELLLSEQARLDSIRDDLIDDGTIVNDDAQEIEEDAAGQHPADTASDEEARDRDIGLLEGVEGELRDVEAALERLDQGTYGQCEVCGRPIPDERLEAYPTARFDVEHEPHAPGGVTDPTRDAAR
jgi:RNA polymerase-binding transcription factor DksA